MKKLIPLVLTLAAAIGTLVATTSVYACIPLAAYQPKMPESLIKMD